MSAQLNTAAQRIEVACLRLGFNDDGDFALYCSGPIAVSQSLLMPGHPV
jgi:hypothetical protein